MQKFDYTLDFKTIDFLQQPELYRVGKGKQCILALSHSKKVGINGCAQIVDGGLH
jgi:hypothetical protein